MKWIIGLGIIAALVIGFVAASQGEGGDSYQAYLNIRTEYPTADIENIPGTNFIFLVKEQNGEVIYIEALNMNDDEISRLEIIFEGDE